jgi:hypothetical protein
MFFDKTKASTSEHHVPLILEGSSRHDCNKLKTQSIPQCLLPTFLSKVISVVKSSTLKFCVGKLTCLIIFHSSVSLTASREHVGLPCRIMKSLISELSLSLKVERIRLSLHKLELEQQNRMHGVSQSQPVLIGFCFVL